MYSPSEALRLITPSRSRNAALPMKQFLFDQFGNNMADQNMALLYAGVSPDGAQRKGSRSAACFSLPPGVPVNAMVCKPIFLAVEIPFSTFGELPLVEKPVA